MSRLQGKVALVTGASKGIGSAIAEQFAGEGAAVVVNYASSRSGADAVVERIKKAGGKALAVQGDLSKAEDIERVLAETTKAFGKLDILVNNAGVYDMQPLEAITEQHFHKQFNLNVLGLLLTTKGAVQLMNGNGGSVINISSVVGPMPSANASVYSATKAAVDAITISLSKELGPRKIRVNSLNPGLIVTEGVKAAGFDSGDFRNHVEAATPLGRVGQPDDIASTALFLASDDSRWVTGQTLIAAGGYRQ